MAEVAMLGTVQASSGYQEAGKLPWFRKPRVLFHPIGFLDWTVDGTPLRSLAAAPERDAVQEATPLRLPADDFGRAYLRGLLEPSSTTNAGWDLRMPDGRVALLFCPVCFDLDCATLTAEVRLEGERVRWLDLAWQVGYEADPDWIERPITSRSITFARPQYEATIRALLTG